MIVAKFNDGMYCEAFGVFQWDYGQELVVENATVSIPDGTEVNFYQGNLSHMGVMRNNHVMIPDIMLQTDETIVAYVYVREVDAGETILSIKIPIQERPRPEDYVLPEYKEYSRLLPAGGKKGQVLTKQTNDDYCTEWKNQSSVDLIPMTDAEIDALFKEV